MASRPAPLALARRLRAEWADLVGTGAAGVLAGEDLLSRWAAPGRHYHTVHHLAAVLDDLGPLGGTSPAVRLAAWYHDAVYDPARDDNEDASAALAASTLAALRVSPPVVKEVGRLVRLTVAHRAAPGDHDGARLCDADLAILGSTPTDYDRYRRAVRSEYAALDDESWRSGRSRVLSGLLDRRRIFATDLGRRRWEAAARTNLAAELRRLGSPGGSAPTGRGRQP